MKKRGSGILLHITSLPSPHGIGDLGPNAYRFVDFLSSSKQSYWQLLPLNPTDQVCGNSPYSSNSAFALNTLLISPELLVKNGLLTEEDVSSRPVFMNNRCDYSSVIPYKERLLRRAYERFISKKEKDEEYQKFCNEHQGWIDDYALFVTIKGRMGGKVFSDWPEELRDREPSCMEAARDEMSDEIERVKFYQYLFMKQWFLLKEYCDKKGVKLIGDIPIYVNYDSVDVWTNPEIFKLDPVTKKPSVVAGVPPDYFSKTGQLWGNPVYRWDRLKETGFDWWMRRLSHVLHLFHMTRIDHFRGFVDFWEVPASHKTAMRGRWAKAEAEAFLTALIERFPESPILAEDLGIITDEVREVMMRFGFPGMRILLFAFGEDKPDHPYLPQNFISNCVVYTGTHDNNTVRGWYKNETEEADRKRLENCIGHDVSADAVHQDLIKLAMESIADTVLIPMQDVLGLGEEARMNVPARAQGNWSWRVLESQLSPDVSKWLRDLTLASKRIP